MTRKKFGEWLLVCLLLALLMPIQPVCAQESAKESFDRKLDDIGLEYRGFLDLRGGHRLVSPVEEQSTSLAEARLQLDLDWDLEWSQIKFKEDLYYDAVEHNGGGSLREAYIMGSPFDFADLKLGRQVLTWGTGDLLFINDLFPKDWQAFFIGRDDEYLKAPADAVKASLFFDLVNIDLVYMPRFNPSNYIDGHRLSYWSPMAGKIVGKKHKLRDHARSNWGRDDEIAIRLFRTFNSIETALYFYDGFWKTPEGMKADGKLFFPKLRSFGLSLRVPLWGGLANLEAGYYDSRDDSSGKDAMIRNSEWRFLAGFEHELGDDFNGGLQYYLEYMSDYDNYRRSLAPENNKRDEFRHLLTLRLTKLLLQQNLTLSFFAYYSPSDSDCHLRPQVSYKLTDNWLLTGGANLFYGRHDYTFFGQFKDNCNAYAGLRYNF